MACNVLAKRMPFHPNELVDARQLLNFITLAETKSYTATAKRLGLTQSAISHSLKALELSLGHSLIRKSGRSIYLTDTGKAIFADATEALKRLTIVRKRCQELNEWGSGQMRIATGYSPCQFMIPEVLREFRRSFPTTEIFLQPKESPACYKALQNGEVDLAIAVEPQEPIKAITTDTLFTDELLLATAAYHPWQTSKNLPLDALKSGTCLLHSRNSYSGHLVLTALRRSGLNLENIIEVGSYGAIHQMVAAGIGYSFLPHWTVREDIQRSRIALRSIPKTTIRRRWVYAYESDRQLSLPEETFLGLCLDAKDCVNEDDIFRYR